MRGTGQSRGGGGSVIHTGITKTARWVFGKGLNSQSLELGTWKGLNS